MRAFLACLLISILSVDSIAALFLHCEQTTALPGEVIPLEVWGDDALPYVLFFYIEDCTYGEMLWPEIPYPYPPDPHIECVWLEPCYGAEQLLIIDEFCIFGYPPVMTPGYRYTIPVLFKGMCTQESVTIYLFDESFTEILDSVTINGAVNHEVDAGGPYQIGAGETIILDGNGSVIHPADEVEMEWTVNDNPVGQGLETSINYHDLTDNLGLAPGVYDVELTVTGLCSQHSDTTAIEIAEEPNLLILYHIPTGDAAVYSDSSVPYHALLGIYDITHGDIGTVIPQADAGNNAGAGENMDGPGYHGHDHVVDIHTSELYPHDTIEPGIQFIVPLIPGDGGQTTLPSVFIVDAVNPPLGDMDDDDDVDLSDFALLSSRWLATDCSSTNDWCQGADIDQINDVDWGDLFLLSYYWLTGVE